MEREDFVRIKKVQANKEEARKLEESKLKTTAPASRSQLPPDQDILAEYEPSADVDVVF